MLDTLPLVVDLNEKLVRAPCTKVGEHNLIAACNSLSCPHLSCLNCPKTIKSCGLLILLYSSNFRSIGTYATHHIHQEELDRNKL